MILLYQYEGIHIHICHNALALEIFYLNQVNDGNFSVNV